MRGMIAIGRTQCLQSRRQQFEMTGLVIRHLAPVTLSLEEAFEHAVRPAAPGGRPRYTVYPPPRFPPRRLGRPEPVDGDRLRLNDKGRTRAREMRKLAFFGSRFTARSKSESARSYFPRL